MNFYGVDKQEVIKRAGSTRAADDSRDQNDAGITRNAEPVILLFLYPDLAIASRLAFGGILPRK